MGEHHPPGPTLIYAVGDVHGCCDLVRKAVDRVRGHARGRDHRMVFLGDYIDRGIMIRETVALLQNLQRDSPTICLRGNHEEMILGASQSRLPQHVSLWLENGGRATARSYGATTEAEDVFASIPKADLQWFESLPLTLELEAQVFVHAGIDPARPLAHQGAKEFLWIGKRFLTAAPEDFVERRHIVHGHALQWEGKPDPRAPELLRHRTNLDTGAYGTGVLTVGVFESGRTGGAIDILSVT